MHWRDLNVWQKSHDLAKEIYKVSVDFPKVELYGLTNQIRRAAISVPTNIVEGFSRNSTKEYIQFLFTSRASLEEIRYLLLLSKELNFLTEIILNDLEGRCEEVSKMLNALIKNLKEKNEKQ